MRKYCESVHNTCQNSDLNKDIGSPRAYRPKSQAVGQQPNESQQLFLRAGQSQLSQPEHGLTAATRERHSVGGDTEQCEEVAAAATDLMPLCLFVTAHLNSTALNKFISVVLAPHRT